MNSSSRFGSLAEAIRLATEAHSDQTHDFGGPYILHPLRVMQRAAVASDYDETTMIVAVLHDIVEDTHVGLKEIELRFGYVVRTLVDALTRRTGETYVDFIDRTKKLKVATLVKICDLKDNLELSTIHPLPEPRRSKLYNRYQEALGVLGGV